MTPTLNMSKLDERKALVLDLKKEKGLEGQKAAVVLALDFSGSMDELYRNGTVQSTVERLMPIAMAFDDNQEIDFYLFQDTYYKAADNITLSNLAGYVDRTTSKYRMGGTMYAPVLRGIFDDFTKDKGGFLGFGKKRKATLEYPVYVIFITDGNNFDKAETEMVMREASEHGLFFQFVGIGNAGFQFLDKLDNLTGRKLDNANFFKIQNLNSETDQSLYSKLLNEFPGWIPQARRAGMIK